MADKKGSQKRRKRDFIFFWVIFVILIFFIFSDFLWNLTGNFVLEDEDTQEYIDLLVKTSDNVFSKKNRSEWTAEMFAEERRGNSKQGYIIQAKPEGWNWGTNELDPKESAIIRIPKEEWNATWLEPEYDRNGEIITERKYRLPLENFLSSAEINDLKNIPYNDKTYREPIIKTVENIKDKIIPVDWENRPDDMILHGSAGTFTICSSGCNYSSLNAWESAQNSDLTGNGSCIANITGGFEDTSAFTIFGWTTTADDYIKIVTVPEVRHDGKWNNTAYMLNVSDANPITIAEDYVYIDGLQIHVHSETAARSYIATSTTINAASHLEISHNLLKGHNEPTHDTDGVNILDADAKVYLYNNILSDLSSQTFSYGISCPGECWVYSNTIYKNGIGLRCGGTCHVKNTLSSNNSYEDFFDSDSGDDYNYCASSDGTANYAGGTGNRINQVFTFVDENNIDLHLDSNDQGALDYGADLSSDGNISFSDDIDGDTRTGTWDIGADEYVAGDTVNPTSSFGTNPVDNYNSSNSSITFDFKTSDNVDIHTIQLWGNWTGWHANYTNTSYTNDTYLNITLDALPDGKYLWGIFSNDSAGNFDWTDTNKTFTVDTTAPSVNIILPTATTYTSSSISFEARTNENSTCNYSINGGATNYTLTANSTGTGHTASKSLSNANYVANFYCSDLAGNKNNTENVSFTVSVSAEEETTTGGGDGRGFLSKPAQFKTNINSYSKTISRGSTDFGGITITNPLDYKKEYKISVQNIEEIISFEEESVTLGPKESKTLEFKIDVKDGKGLYVGKIIITSGLERKEILVSLNVRSGRNLFDVSLFIPNEQRLISPGSVLTSQINLVEMGVKENIDVTLHYIIKDFTGRIYLDESETLAVYDQKELNKEFNTENLLPEDYVLGVELIYPGGVAVASSQFKVQGEFFGQSFDKFALIGIGVLVIVIFGTVFFVIRRYKDLEKKFKKIKKTRIRKI